jgi:hypothetical protein
MTSLIVVAAMAWLGWSVSRDVEAAVADEQQ